MSIPDRRRIDSDVRAFLREPSTPWIVFDQDGRPPSQLAVGELLSGPRRTLLSDYDFAAAAAKLASDTAPEPSSLALASDLTPPAADGLVAIDVDVELPAVSAFRRRAVGASVAALACLAVVGAMLLGGASTRASTQASPAPRSAAASIVDRPVAPAAPVVTDLGASAKVAATPPARKTTRTSTKKLGRLAITGAARSKNVYLDGKRLLGRGARSFMVKCGVHSIAVGHRRDARDLEVPCNAELLLTK